MKIDSNQFCCTESVYRGERVKSLRLRFVSRFHPCSSIHFPFATLTHEPSTRTEREPLVPRRDPEQATSARGTSASRSAAAYAEP